MNENLVLGQFGTFDVENFGDLIYPVLFKRMIHQRYPGAEVRKFSLMGSKSLQDSGYHTTPVRKLLSSRREKLHSLVVGGGDLLRTDWDAVASHYRSLCQRLEEQSPSFSWRRWYMEWRKIPIDPDAEFRRRYMKYPAVGPFVIERPRSSRIKSIAYCSCGVPFLFDDALKQKIADTFNKSIFIYVRDQQSKHALLQAGVTREIHVAPDLVVALSDFFDAAAERERGRALLQKLGVDIHRRLLCFQSNPQPPENTAELVKQLKAYQQRTGCEIILLPLGWCHGDREYLKQLADDSAGAFKYVELNSIFEIIAAIAACDIFLGTSLHGNITAFSFGIPHLFGPIPVTKREGFLEAVDLPSDLKLNSWAEINEQLDCVTSLGGEFFASRAATAKRRVHKTFDRLFRTVTSA